jgi:hypothetical protein
MSDDSLSIAKQVVDLAKELAGALAPESAKSAETSRASRGGPLLVVGRLYVGLTTIAALAATAAAYIDKSSDRAPSYTVAALRILVLGAVALGLFGGGYLLYYLAKKHPSYLFSPTEFANEVHAQMMEQGLPDEDASRPKPDNAPGEKSLPGKKSKAAKKKTPSIESEASS